jgi:hypothetical protein
MDLEKCVRLGSSSFISVVASVVCVHVLWLGPRHCLAWVTWIMWTKSATSILKQGTHD